MPIQIGELLPVTDIGNSPLEHLRHRRIGRRISKFHFGVLIYLMRQKVGGLKSRGVFAGQERQVTDASATFCAGILLHKRKKISCIVLKLFIEVEAVANS